MSSEIEILIKKIALADVKIKLLNAQLDGMIIPEIVFEIINDLKQSYGDKK